MQSRERKTAWQRERRAQAAIAAGREPHRTGRPAKPKPPPQPPVVIPPLHLGHPLFDEARRLTGLAPDERSTTLVRRDRLMREDGLSEAVLALLEQRDAREAWRRFRSREMTWLYRTAPLIADD